MTTNADKSWTRHNNKRKNLEQRKKARAFKMLETKKAIREFELRELRKEKALMQIAARAMPEPWIRNVCALGWD